MKDDFFATKTPLGFAFAGGALDRLSAKRDDAAFVAELRARPEARFLLIARDMPLLTREPREVLFTLAEAERLGPSVDEILLGVREGGSPLFAARLPDAAVEMREDHSDGFLDKRVLVIPGREDLELADMRMIAATGMVDPPSVALLGAAKAMCHWHARHQFCANCGAPTRFAAAGFRRECDACKAQHFPRTDPVVIMLAVDGERCLLGRQPRFPKSMYSALAGFVEPGETIEEAVRREIHEEAGIMVDEVAYVASQPWPFPASLMIGCLARAKTRDIFMDHEELEDARWFTRDEAHAMFEKRHPEGLMAPVRMAIANHLLRVWLGR